MLPWRSKGNFEESVFSFPWVGPGDETPVNRLDINFFLPTETSCQPPYPSFTQIASYVSQASLEL